MSRSSGVHELRRRTAREALGALGPSPSESAVLVVHCAAGHHVGAVHRSADGLLYAGVPWAHGHGQRDRVDAAHRGGHRDTPWVDWIDPSDTVDEDDAIPAGCECGHRSLSRARLLAALAAGVRRMIID